MPTDIAQELEIVDVTQPVGVVDHQGWRIRAIVVEVVRKHPLIEAMLLSIVSMVIN